MTAYTKIQGLAFMAISLLSCVQANEPIRIISTSPLRGSRAQCVLDTVQLPRGTLDIAVEENYALGFTIESSLEPLAEQVGTTTVSSENRNDFIAEQMVFSYKTTPARKFPDEKTPVFFVVPAAAADLPLIFRGLLTQNVMKRLRSEVAVGDTFLLNIELYFEGRLASGGKIRSNTIAFPITVKRSDFEGCPDGLTLEENGPCGRVGGQDDAPIKCVASNP